MSQSSKRTSSRLSEGTRLLKPVLKRPGPLSSGRTRWVKVEPGSGTRSTALQLWHHYSVLASWLLQMLGRGIEPDSNLLLTTSLCSHGPRFKTLPSLCGSPTGIVTEYRLEMCPLCRKRSIVVVYQV